MTRPPTIAQLRNLTDRAAHGLTADEQARLREGIDRLAGQPPTDRMLDVQGRCPACGWTSLFLGNGGHVTCSRLECPNPSAADDMLHAEPAPATPATTTPRHNDGPTVTECRDADRRWWNGEKAGER